MPRLKIAYHDPTNQVWYRLLNVGATINVQVEPHPNDAAAMTQSGATVPSPVAGEALIDTGASVTVIDERVFQALTPPVIDYVQIKGYRDAASTRMPVCFVRITFPASDLPAYQRPMGVAPLASKTRDQKVLLGRDFLRKYKLIYDGRQGEVTLESP